MNSLPQSVKILIGEFNADHREKMRSVLYELLVKENTCWYCDEGFDNTKKEIQYIMFRRYAFCCLRCAADGEELIREQH